MDEKEEPVCIICGKRPSSYYVRVDSRARRNDVSYGLLGIVTDRLFADHPDAVGVVCLSCLTAYRKRDASSFASERPAGGSISTYLQSVFS